VKVGIFLIEKTIFEFKQDYESVYHTWFLNNEDRLKAFRSIRKGLEKVILEIENDTFGNEFKGSSLETVVTAISEQKQVFERASHPFHWKPKLRIPDIYENESNKKIFGSFLKFCLRATNEEQIIAEIYKLDSCNIKGLGPAVANILYFLYPTLFPPFNTAILNGFNILFNQKRKLGSWKEYLIIRDNIIETNNKFRKLLSNDLGAFSGLLYEIGSNRLITDKNAEGFLNNITEKIEKANKKRHKQIEEDENEDNLHSEMQYYLAQLGKALGYHIWIAKNDHQRSWNNTKLGDFSIRKLSLPDLPTEVLNTVSLIDVLWLDDEDNIVSGFEVEKSTSIYSGILRLSDLSISLQNDKNLFFLVAPEKREKEIIAQLLRPSFRNLGNLSLSYILFHDLRCDCDAMCKFGNDKSVLEKIAKTVD